MAHKLTCIIFLAYLNMHGGHQPVQLTQQQVHDEIKFWSDLFLEHAFFLSLMVGDKTLNQKATDIQEKFEKFKKELDKNQSQLSSFLNLADQLKELQETVDKKIKNKEWVGWVYPAFIKHLQLETDYVQDKLNNKIDPTRELLFWDNNNKDHVKLIAQLLDPSEKKLIERAKKLAQQCQLPDKESIFLTGLTQKNKKELDDYYQRAKDVDNFQQEVKNNPPKSVIHPVLLEHMIKENNRGLGIIKQLKNINT